MIRTVRTGALSAVVGMMVAVTLISGPAMAAGEKVAQIDTRASVVKWLGKKVTAQHNGTVRIKGGTVEFKGDQLIGGRFEIDMNSISNEDLKDPEWNGKLVSHLKSDDFFSVAKHPVATFKITKVKELKKKDATHEITGDLTIKGITHPVTFPAKVETKNGKTSAKASLKVDRTKWNVRFRSGKFFEGLGDKMIHDDFQLDLEILSL